MLAPTDTDGLAQLAEQARGHELRCERALLRAGKPLGFAAAPLPGWARAGRAMLAFGVGCTRLGTRRASVSRIGFAPAQSPAFLALKKTVRSFARTWLTDAGAAPARHPVTDERAEDPPALHLLEPGRGIHGAGS